VLCSLPDVVKTYKSIVSHWPIFQDAESARSHAFFLTPKSKFKDQMIWYKDIPVGRNTLSKVAQKLAEDVPSLSGKRITNKTGRNTGITRLEEAMVPLDRAIQLTGHRDSKSYKKYSKQRFENASACAMQSVMSSGAGIEAPLSYEDAMSIEKKRLEAIKVTN
jgi:hypothetical protein